MRLVTSRTSQQLRSAALVLYAIDNITFQWTTDNRQLSMKNSV
ncbi:hypothetical protein [Microseira sp. BLCC-F43]